MEIEKMQDKLDMKNTYIHHFKQDEAKERDQELENSKSHVFFLSFISILFSSCMIKQKETLIKITVKNANMNQNGASTERKER